MSITAVSPSFAIGAPASGHETSETDEMSELLQLVGTGETGDASSDSSSLDLNSFNEDSLDEEPSHQETPTAEPKPDLEHLLKLIDEKEKAESDAKAGLKLVKSDDGLTPAGVAVLQHLDHLSVAEKHLRARALRAYDRVANPSLENALSLDKIF